MILKDAAIALRIHPFGNTSRIVVWLSATHGKLATLVKGSQRERSPFLGQYDLFYTCELLFYAREHRNLHILKECFPLELRSAFRASYANRDADLLNQLDELSTADAFLTALRLFEVARRAIDELSEATAPKKLTSNTSRNSDIGRSSTGPPRATPALLTTADNE